MRLPSQHDGISAHLPGLFALSFEKKIGSLVDTNAAFRTMVERSLFRAGFSEGYLLIPQDIALKTSLILSSLLEPKWSQAVQI
jgi:hypothetical protein